MEGVRRRPKNPTLAASFPVLTPTDIGAYVPSNRMGGEH